MPIPAKRTVVLAFELMLALTFAGCAYTLHPATPPTQIRLRLMAKTPDMYNVRLRIREAREWRVPPDGRVTLDVPAYRTACTVSLFGVLKLPNRSDVYTGKTIDLLAGTKTARQLSLKKIFALPLDADGYRVLRASKAR